MKFLFMVATPFTSVAVPSNVPFSLNSTVPVGVPAPGATADTTARNWTLWLLLDGFGVVVKLTDVAAFVTVNVPFANAIE